MLYYLFDYLDSQFDVIGAGLFQYISFRSALAFILSLLISTIYGKRIINYLQLKQVGGSTYNKYGQMGDNGAQTKSPSLQNSGQAGMDSKPVRFSGQAESVPNSPKAPSNAYAKGETSVKGAGSFKNAPGTNNFTEKGESTPKPVTKDAAGAVKSPVAESRKTTRRIVK